MSEEMITKKELSKRRWETFLLIPLLICIILCTNMAFSLSDFASSLSLFASIFFFGVVNINLILLAILIFLIAKNLSKLFFERKTRAVGAKLKSKLVIAFLSLSIIPTMVLFFISSLYINSAFDKWFSVRIKNTLQASAEISDAYYKDHQRNALHFAKKIRKTLIDGHEKSTPFAFSSSSFQLERRLEKQRLSYSLSAIELYSGPLDPRYIIFGKELQKDFFPRLPIEDLKEVLAGNTRTIVQQLGAGDILRSIIPVYAYAPKYKLEQKKTPPIIGVLAVSYFIPTSIVEKAMTVSTAVKDYGTVNPLEYPIKSSYLSILIFITLLIIFVAIWAGLYLARQLTGPLESLEKAAKKVGSGDLNVELHNIGNDEISTVVTAFNKMTVDLKRNRNQLKLINKKLDEERTYMEVVLSNVSAGVLAIDANGKITTINKSAANLLKISSTESIGKYAIELFSRHIAQLSEIIKKAVQQADLKQVRENLKFFSNNEEAIEILITATANYDKNNIYQGLVLVLDDITHITKQQRETAWIEIARRIAHEIKNPLTPIKLSAQRLRKRISSLRQEEEQKILEECTETIVRQVNELKEMINEFSEYARLPEANPSYNDINAAIREIVDLYQQGHKDIEFYFKEDKSIPKFFFDREQIKRVTINFFANAVTALKENRPKARKSVRISTQLHASEGTIEIKILDNGPGIPKQVLPMLFEPYFSTKKEGTGLGLAIAKKIITDHSGRIRISSPSEADEKASSGTCFIIELPMQTVQNMGRGNKEVSHEL